MLTVVVDSPANWATSARVARFAIDPPLF